MKNILSKITFLLLAIFLPMSIYYNASASNYPQVERLQNGLTILVHEDSRFPIVSSRLYVKAGSSMEMPGEFGISHLLEHMVFKGSKTHPQGIDKMIEERGGSLNAYTSYDQTVYYNDMPASDWKISLEAIQGLAFDPLLRTNDLAKELEVVLAELKQRGDEPSVQLLHLSTATSLKGTDYAHPVIGVEEDLKKITPQDIRNYIQRNYDPSEMLLVVVGDVKAQDVFHESKRLFSQYKNLNNRNFQAPYTDKDLANLATGFEITVKKGNWNKSHVTISFPMPHENSEHTNALNMLAILLDFDDNALLPKQLRFNNKIVDTIYTYNLSLDRIGLFNIYARLDTDKIPFFMEKITDILRSLDANNFSDKELAQARNAIENAYWKSNTTIQDTADTYGDLYWSNPNDPLGKTWLDAIKNVNREQINTVIKNYIHADAMSLSVLLPETDTLDINKITLTQKSMWKSKPKRNDITSTSGETEVLQIGNKTLLLTPDTHIPFMTVDVNFLGGESLLENAELKQKGNAQTVPTLTARTITDAIKGMNSKKLTAYLSEKDIDLYATSQALFFSITAHGATNLSNEIFTLVNDVIKKPSFNKKDLEKAKEDQITKILAIKDSVTSSLMYELKPFLFQGHAYGSHYNGTEETVNAVTQKDIHNFWQIQKEQAMVISIAGDFKREEAIAFVEQLPDPAYSVQKNSLSIGSPHWTKEKDLHVTVEGRNQDIFGILFKTVDKHHEDAPALQVLASALSGFNSVLHQELREKRNLGYSTGPIPFLAEKAGFFAFYIIASAEHRNIIEEQFEIITKMLEKDGITQETIDMAKASLAMDYVNGSQTVTQRAQTVAIPVLFGHNLHFNKELYEKAQAVSKEDLDAVIKKYFIYDNAYTFHAGAN